MKTKLLSQLRKEAEYFFDFKITSNSYETWVFVDSRGRTIKGFLDGSFLREQARAYCREEIRNYILYRVKEIKKKKQKKVTKNLVVSKKSSTFASFKQNTMRQTMKGDAF